VIVTVVLLLKCASVIVVAVVPFENCKIMPVPLATIKPNGDPLIPAALFRYKKADAVFPVFPAAVNGSVLMVAAPVAVPLLVRVKRA
jgi:hypothetical protein